MSTDATGYCAIAVSLHPNGYGTIIGVSLGNRSATEAYTLAVDHCLKAGGLIRKLSGRSEGNPSPAYACRGSPANNEGPFQDSSSRQGETHSRRNLLTLCAPAWLRLIPDLRLLNGSAIPPVVPNVINVRIMNCPKKIEDLSP